MLKIVLFAMYDKSQNRKPSLVYPEFIKKSESAIISDCKCSGLQYNCFFYNYSVYSFV
jgi:hypothetical protein